MNGPGPRALQVLVVVGPGAFGRSFAGWAARCGLEVRLVGRDRAHAERAVESIQSGWRAEIAKGRMTPEEADLAAGLLRSAESLPAALAGANVLLEALPEALDAKVPFWRGLGGWEGLRLSGSSSIPMAELALAAGLARPPLGFHGFVPMSRMGVVELVVPEDCEPGAVDASKRLAAALHKQVVQVQDQAGFAASRMALAQGLEAMRLLEAGAADRDGLDALMSLGYGHPIGPLELSDRVGLDLRLAIAERLHAGSGQSAFEPPRILRELVATGRTGRAVGHGFYEWDAEGRKR